MKVCRMWEGASYALQVVNEGRPVVIEMQLPD